MINRRTRASRNRAQKGLVPQRGNSLPEVYLSRTQSSSSSLFDKDHSGANYGAKFKWLVSTLIAGTVGVAALGVALYGAMNVEDGSGMVESLRNASVAALKPFQPKTMDEEQLTSSFGKTDRLPATSQGLSTKYIIHDSIVQKRGEREFIAIQPYARIVARLATGLPVDAPDIPLFNPFKLYANLDPISSGKEKLSKVKINLEAESNVIELVGGILPTEDGQELNDQDVQKIVAEEFEDANFAMRATIYNDQENGDVAAEEETVIDPALKGKNVTNFEKSIIIPDRDTIEGLENQIVTVGAKDTLTTILARAKVSSWQAPAIVEAMQPIFESKKIREGSELHLMLAPSLTRVDEMDLVRISIYASGVHLVSVARNAEGEFIASNHGAHSALLEQLTMQNNESSRATLYKAFYQSSLKQSLDAAKIMKVLRIHAYDTDFKQRVSPGDGFELFYDLQDAKKQNDGRLGELLYTALTVGGETRKFYRFRTPDGEVDYYDENGDNAKKFLMRKPVRGGGARLTSGYGRRFHPLLKRRKMHKGVDWAAKPGTPIFAAGNGKIEEAKRHSGYGNYVRIRHANSYKTAYGHMLRFGKGIRKGVKVRQGQVIGYVGSTGLSSGPHLHYEILVNNRHVNPMRIHVPQGRKLVGKEMGNFQKERKRIDELMRRSPVKTRVAKNEN